MTLALARQELAHCAERIKQISETLNENKAPEELMVAAIDIRRFALGVESIAKEVFADVFNKE